MSQARFTEAERRILEQYWKLGTRSAVATATTSGETPACAAAWEITSQS